MAKRFYPAVLERGPKGSFAIWFPDFPDCVAGGTTQEDALAKSELALAKAVDALAEADRSLPQPTAFEAISLPKGSRPIAYFAVSVEPPNPSERVNIYLPRNLITRADKRAEELGMSRSSFFGLAISSLIGWSYKDMTSLTAPRSKIETGEKSSPVKRKRE
jgi:predicted RNase H-like HicB family nuclease